ncbi:MAG: DNA-processing protein DprA [Pseudomonadota bacterium]
MSLDKVEEVTDWLRFDLDQRWNHRQKLELLSAYSAPQRIFNEFGAGLINASLHKSVQQFLEQSDQHLLSLNCADYPMRLKQISDPPLLLYAKGNIDLLKEPTVAIVGSRRPTEIGRIFADRVAYELASLGIAITSGLALGVDGAAHQGCLRAKQGTIAVLGCGVDIIYPTRHRNLYAQINDEGLLLSEFHLGAGVTRYAFPKRNRIISGLSLATVIVEAAQKSGTLITAKCALEQNRDVFVAPGGVLSQQYAGSNDLIKQGAALITRSDDVLQGIASILDSEFVRKSTSKTTDPGLDAQSKSLLSHLNGEPLSVDEIIERSGLTAPEVSSMLLVLEMQGVVAMTEGGDYFSLA